MAELCVLSVARRCREHTDAHDKHVPLRAAAQLLCCRSCHDRLAYTLAELPALDDDLVLQLRRHGTVMQPKVSGSGSLENEPPFVSMTVVNHRARMTSRLVWWAWNMAEARRLHPCATTVKAATAALLTHLDWICAQPPLPDFARDLLALSKRAAQLAYPAGCQRITLGPCVECTSCDVRTREPLTCPGTLTASVAQVDDLLPSSIDCDTCGAGWSADRWLALGRRIYKAA